MKVTLLGTGWPLPSPDRAGPATLVQAGGMNMLFDCGRGVLMRLAAAGLPTPVLLHTTYLTHLHSDHVTDFNDVVTTRWITSPENSPLVVVGPVGTDRFASRTLEMLADDIGYRVGHHEDLNWEPGIDVTEVADGDATPPLLASAGITVTAAPTDHRPVSPTVGYRIEHEGSTVAIAGDTVPCDGLHRLVAGADVYVQTVIRDDIIRNIPMQRFQDVCDYHSTVADAARTAARGGVRTLVLTHMVPAPAPGGEQEWIDLAAEHFDGEILAPPDLAAIEA